VSVLALNLPVTSSADIIEGLIYEHAQAGEPLRLTLRQLAIGEIEVAPGAVVPVCENPSVVAQAAALLEQRSAPLVCAEGQPNSAVHALLDLLVSGGSLTAIRARPSAPHGHRVSLGRCPPSGSRSMRSKSSPP